MNCHLVTVVSGECGTYQWVKLNSLAVNEYRLESLCLTCVMLVRDLKGQGDPERHILGPYKQLALCSPPLIWRFWEFGCNLLPLIHVSYEA